jgi:hypothetical protein
MCPLCGRALYLEHSTGDPVCLSCCKTKRGDRYTLLSFVEESRESVEPKDTTSRDTCLWCTKPDGRHTLQCLADNY